MLNFTFIYYKSKTSSSCLDAERLFLFYSSSPLIIRLNVRDLTKLEELRNFLLLKPSFLLELLLHLIMTSRMEQKLNII